MASLRWRMVRNCANKTRASVYPTVLMVMVVVGGVVVMSLRRAVRMVWI
jgi:hypothetical protein